jgi:hypothetical protein
MDNEVNVSGPVFDGRADAALRAYEDDAAEAIAYQGYNMVQAELHRVLRNPTGYYQSKIRVTGRRREYRLDDSGVVYGPWLEGTSRRNQTTRFKGYSTFRRVKQRLDTQALQIGERVLPPYLRRMQ